MGPTRTTVLRASIKQTIQVYGIVLLQVLLGDFRVPVCQTMPCLNNEFMQLDVKRFSNDIPDIGHACLTRIHTTSDKRARLYIILSIAVQNTVLLFPRPRYLDRHDHYPRYCLRMKQITIDPTFFGENKWSLDHTGPITKA